MLSLVYTLPNAAGDIYRSIKAIDDRVEPIRKTMSVLERNIISGFLFGNSPMHTSGRPWADSNMMLNAVALVIRVVRPSSTRHPSLRDRVLRLSTTAYCSQTGEKAHSALLRLENLEN